MNAENLETQRLILRMFDERDFDAHARICADPQVMRYIGGGKPLNSFEAWQQIASILGHWQLRGYGYWAVEEKSSGRLIGRIGFFDPAGWAGFELGWTLGREFWGQGYATEGTRRALAYAFEDLKRERVISLIHPENRASIKVAERLGEKSEGQIELFGSKALIYGIDRTQWLAIEK